MSKRISEIEAAIAACRGEIADYEDMQARLRADIDGFDYAAGTADQAAAKLSKFRTELEVVSARIDLLAKRGTQFEADLAAAKRAELVERLKVAESELPKLRERVRPDVVKLFAGSSVPIRFQGSFGGSVEASVEVLIDMTAEVREQREKIRALYSELNGFN